MKYVQILNCSEFWLCLVLVLVMASELRFSRLWREQHHRKHWLISWCKHKSALWTERLTVSWLSIDKSHPLSQAWLILHPAEPLCFSQVPQPDKLHPPQTLILPFPELLLSTAAFLHRTQEEESKALHPWSFPGTEVQERALRRTPSCPGHPRNAAHFPPAPAQSSACDWVQSKATASPWQGLSWQSQLQRNRLMLIYPLSTAFQGVGAFEESKAIGSSFCFPRRGTNFPGNLTSRLKKNPSKQERIFEEE